MHLQKAIEEFGLSPHEAKLYLAALAHGEATLSELARTAKLPRTSCYEAVHGLQKRELLNFYVKRRRRYFIAENPEKFIFSLRSKEAVLREAIPHLLAMRSGRQQKPSVRFYEGIEGIRTIFRDMLDAKRPIVALTEMDWAKRLLAGEFEEFIRRRVEQKLPLKLLTARTAESLRLKVKDAQEFRETRFLPEGSAFETAQWNYGDRMAIFSLSQVHPIGLIIEDSRIANTQRILFELAWQQGSLQ